MSEVALNIKHWGNNLGVRLPALIVREADLHDNQRVSISVVDKKVIITPILEESVTLGGLLADFNPKQHGGELMVVAKSLGAEKW